jgi:hypothetical protein
MSWQAAEFCNGCGCYPTVHAQHRVDCVNPEAVAARAQTGQGHCTRGGHQADLHTITWTGTQWTCRDCTTNQENANA